MVKCPICSDDIPLKHINDHLDDCELKQKRQKKSEEDKNSKDKIDEKVNSDSNKDEEQQLIEDIDKNSQAPKKSLSSLLTGNLKQKDRPRTYKWSPPSQQTQSISQDIVNGDKKHNLEQHQVSSPAKKQKLTPVEQLKLNSHLPLSERLRPTDLNNYIGQKHLVGPHGILRGYLARGKVPSLILWGYPGTGKTTLARILGKSSHCRVVEMSGVMHGVSDCKKVFEEAQNEIKLTKKPTIVFVDEIHRFNKSQQDVFLGYVERGIIILIGATTENPSFNVNKALLSRCRVFVLEKLGNDEVKELLTKGFAEINKVRRLIQFQRFLKVTAEALDWIISVADGDGRLALGCVELIDSHFNDEEKTDNEPGVIEVQLQDVKSILKKSTVLYDRVGDAHYDTISAFHKSIRGSNPDAAMYYLARMLNGGEDPLYIARRMIRIASEDIGVLDDSCLPFATAAYQAVQFVGLPEADLALVHCAVKLARAPKSIEIYRGWHDLKEWMKNPSIAEAEIPLHLRNAPTKLMSDLGYKKGYKYNPQFKDGKVKQTYFPSQLGEKTFLEGQHLGDDVDPDLYL